MKNPKSFEDGILKLEEILAQISDEATPLTKAVSLYSDAVQLIAFCNESLGEAKLKIEEIDSFLKTKNNEINIDIL